MPLIDVRSCSERSPAVCSPSARIVGIRSRSCVTYPETHASGSRARPDTRAAWSTSSSSSSAVSVLSGVLIAGLALPWVAMVNKGADAGADGDRGLPAQARLQAARRAHDGARRPGQRRWRLLRREPQRTSRSTRSPTVMQKAIIAIEDARFYEHGAIDVQGTIRALLVNEASDASSRVARRITQQLVKLTLLKNATTTKQQRQAIADELRPQVQRAALRRLGRGPPHQGPDPRALPQHRLLRRRRLRRRVGRPPLLRHHAPTSSP